MRALLRKELWELWRTRRVLIVFAVLFVFGLIGPLSVKYMPVMLANMPGVPEGIEAILPEPDVNFALDEFIQNLTQFGVILAVLVPMGAVVGEKARGTAVMVLSKAVSRSSFLDAKWVAYSALFLAAILVAGLGGYYYLGVLFEWLPILRFLAMVSVLGLYLLIFVSVTLFASTVSPSQPVAAGISFGLLIFLGVLRIVRSLSGYLPGRLLEWGQGLAMGNNTGVEGSALLFAAILIVGAWLGARFIINRQEF